MLLAVDIGNTRAKWGWHAHGRWIARHAATHDAFFAALMDSAPPGAAPERAIVCNVADEALGRQVIAAIEQAWPGVQARSFRSGPSAGGLRNAYADPGSLGADRLAAAVGARVHVRAGALVVASFGTATTIDTVSPGNEFLGGVILPGVALMLRSLAHHTARLPLGQAQNQIHDIPAATPDAIAEGVIRAQVGAVRETLERARARFGAAQLVVTGGAAPAVAWRLPAPVHLADNLVFDGLLRIDGMQT